MSKMLKEKIINRCDRISKLVEQNAPPIILENERRQLNKLIHLWHESKEGK